MSTQDNNKKDIKYKSTDKETIPLLIISFLIIKIFYMYLMFGIHKEYNEYSLILSINTYQNELIIFIPLILIYYFTNIHYFIKYFISLSLLFLVYLDFQSLIFFGRKISIEDFIKFSNEFNIVFIKYILLLLFVFIIMMIISLILARIIKKRKKVKILLVISFILSLFIPSNIVFFKQEYLTSNFIKNNINRTYLKRYKNNTKKYKSFQEGYKEYIGEGEKSNFIIIFAESWSAIDSKRTSNAKEGILNNFDELTKEGKIFKNLFSEGTTTDEAYVSYFNMLPKINYNNNYNAYTPFYLDDNLIYRLNNNNYYTSFVKTFFLSFLNQDKFLKFLKFDNISGRENEFNKGKFYSLGGESDKNLYKFALNHITKIKQPFYLNLTTFSTHIPYETPDGNGLKKAYEFSDKEFKLFYNELKKRNYFDNNYLILFGDHRKMRAVGKEELEIYGEESFSRVAGAIWGKGIAKNSIDNNYYNLRDISSSIVQKISKGKIYLNKFNNIFTNKIDRDYVVFKNYNNNNIIDIFQDKKSSKHIILDGDNTHYKNNKNKDDDAMIFIKNYLGSMQYLEEESQSKK